MAEGLVSLVGAGPGDPGLLTLRGAERLRQAEVVVYDRLASPELLELAPQGAERIYVGKSAGQHAMSQAEIDALLVERAQAGQRVVRLKGGDPFVFGRGGEEALTLARAGLRFEIVPGVSSAIAAAAYAGIPVTHRDLASSVTIVTGHEDPTRSGSRLDWQRLAAGADTLVILMGVERLAEIAAELARGGRPSSQPAAVIEWGTTSRQRVVTAPLDQIADVAAGAAISPPAVLVVGDVAALRSELDWFQRGPLSGKRVLVTRARDQASRLSQLLRERGAEPFEFPAIQIRWLLDPAPLDQAIQRLDAYQWVVFTSANGMEAVFQRLDAIGLDVRAFGRSRLCAIGPATAEALGRRGLRADWVPAEFLTAAILRGFGERGVADARMLLPRANIADPSLARGLVELGATVDDVTAYYTVPANENAEGLIDLLQRRQVDIATFASSSTVRNLHDALGSNCDLLSTVQTVCIGPVTAAAARELGLRIDAVADTHTIDGLVEAVEQIVLGTASRAVTSGSPT